MAFGFFDGGKDDDLNGVGLWMHTSKILVMQYTFSFGTDEFNRVYRKLNPHREECYEAISTSMETLSSDGVSSLINVLIVCAASQVFNEHT